MLPLYKRIALKILNRFFDWLPDKNFIKIKFYLNLGYKLNLSNPLTFNEKLQWLKLNNRKPLYTDLVDKIKVKGYVSKLIGKEYIIPTIATFQKPEDINFELLPDKFVVKCNHNSGGVVICKDKTKLNVGNVIRNLKKNLQTDYYRIGREWPYKNVNRAILVEELLETHDNDIKDYKFYCFNGKVKCCLVCTGRSAGDLRMNFYDENWQLLPFTRHYPNTSSPINPPESLNEMIILAEKLAGKERFVRIDFYDVSGRIYFGEMTFYPGNGWGDFSPVSWDLQLGKWLNIETDE